jgi:DNA repair protein RadD
MAVSPTGSGKTHTATNLIGRTGYTTVFVAHRQELVLQISESLAAQGIFHNIIAPSPVVGFCVERHAKRFGRSYYKPNAGVSVAGVRTLLTRSDRLRSYLASVQLWITDEAHHVLAGNQWGQAVKLFPNAFGLGVTATPLRCDRQGLDGVFDDLIIGPSMRDLINQGHLCDYRIFCPPTSLDLDAIRVSQSTGEFVHKDVVREVEKSQIVGDVVSHYQRIAGGKRGLTFAVDLKEAAKLAHAFEAAGVPAAVVSADTPDRVRVDLLDRLADGRILQLVNVDLFGEGMDCPALDVISMARPTQSYGLYVQQFGRVLRPYPGKERGIVIDHVGNVVRHGLPDKPRDWSLAAPERKKRSVDPDEIPLTTCRVCFQPYERFRTKCPHCGAIPVPEQRGTPQQVDGDLIELSPEVLEAMRNEVRRIDDGPQIPRDATPIMVAAIQKKWAERQTAQNALREAMGVWCGIRKVAGETDREIQKRFYFEFGVDMMTAQQHGPADANALKERVDRVIAAC